MAVIRFPNLAETGPLVAEDRWLPELDTKRRLEGDYFWLKPAYPFS